MRVHSVLPPEPGAEGDPAGHRGTILRMVARDTEGAARLSEDLRAASQRALVVAGEHEYGVQLDGQLDHVGLPRAERAEEADAALLSALRIAGPFDEHGDPVEPPVRLYRASADWSLEPDRPV